MRELAKRRHEIPRDSRGVSTYLSSGHGGRRCAGVLGGLHNVALRQANLAGERARLHAEAAGDAAGTPLLRHPSGEAEGQRMSGGRFARGTGLCLRYFISVSATTARPRVGRVPSARGRPLTRRGTGAGCSGRSPRAASGGRRSAWPGPRCPSCASRKPRASSATLRAEGESGAQVSCGHM